MTDAVAPDGGRVLWLLRHAKAAADPPPGGTDHDRPLAPRGRADATALGRLLGDGELRGAGPPPGLALCSTAARATETAELALTGIDAVLGRRRSLYDGAPEDVLRELSTVADDVPAVIVVGHNPTIQVLALDLLAPADTEGRATLERSGFPTCALACYRLAPRRWRGTASGTATLTGFFTPPY